MYYTYLHNHQLKDLRHQPVEGAKPVDQVRWYEIHIYHSVMKYSGLKFACSTGKACGYRLILASPNYFIGCLKQQGRPQMESWQNNVFYPELWFFWLVSEPSVSPERFIFDDLWLSLIIFDDRRESLTILNPELGFLVPQRQHHDAKYNGSDLGRGDMAFQPTCYLPQRKLLGHIPFPVQGNESMP